MSLGFSRAGCQILGGLEVDRDAAQSHAKNFHRDVLPNVFENYARPHDIIQTDPDTLLQGWGHDAPTHAVDVLIGGPPCIAFTRIGRAKLRSTLQHPEAFRVDPRARLYKNYLTFVERLQPLSIAMENVPDIMNWGGRNVAEEIARTLRKLGYRCIYTLLNAVNYGVPQMRERFFLMGIHERLGIDPVPPTPTHRAVLPPGYHHAREVALRLIREEPLLRGATCYVEAPSAAATLPGPVTVRQALDDLPRITGHRDGSIVRGARRFDTAVPYRADRVPSPYADLMRKWEGFSSVGTISDHVIRSLSERDYRLFELMKHGDDYPRARALAEDLWKKELSARREEGEALSSRSNAYRDLRADYVPPYDPTKFPNKWRKMEPDEPARTLMAHLGKDSYSHIHYDSEQARVISVREAARLQSFPDGFVFEGAMNAALKQIGNAVPPLLALALAKALVTALTTASSSTRREPELAAAGT